MPMILDDPFCYAKGRAKELPPTFTCGILCHMTYLCLGMLGKIDQERPVEGLRGCFGFRCRNRTPETRLKLGIDNFLPLLVRQQRQRGGPLFLLSYMQPLLFLIFPATLHSYTVTYKNKSYHSSHVI